MSSFNRRFVLLSSAAALASCGFAPAYGPSGSATVLQNAVTVDEPSNRASYLLVRELEQRLGRSGSGRFGLSHAIDLSEDAIAISANDVTTRYSLLGTVTYALRDLDNGVVLTSGKLHSFTSYSASGTTVATQSAQRDAEARLMVILADQLITRLIAASPGLPT